MINKCFLIKNFLVIICFFFSCKFSVISYKGLKKDFNVLPYISLDTILIRGNSIEIQITDTSDYISPHFDTELFLYAIRNSIDYFIVYEKIIIHIKYTNRDEKSSVNSVSFGTLKYMIDVRYNSGNIIFERIASELLNDIDAKETIDLFIGHYLGQIRHNDPDGMYNEDLGDFFFSYSFYCSSGSNKMNYYLDTLNILKTTISESTLNMDAKKESITFLDMCINQCK